MRRGQGGHILYQNNNCTHTCLLLLLLLLLPAACGRPRLTGRQARGRQARHRRPLDDSRRPRPLLLPIDTPFVRTPWCHPDALPGGGGLTPIGVRRTGLALAGHGERLAAGEVCVDGLVWALAGSRGTVCGGYVGGSAWRLLYGHRMGPPRTAVKRSSAPPPLPGISSDFFLVNH